MFKRDNTAANFWNSYEIDCISRDIPYKDYVNIHARFKHSHKIVNEASYIKLREIFHEEMEYDMNDQNSA